MTKTLDGFPVYGEISGLRARIAELEARLSREVSEDDIQRAMAAVMFEAGTQQARSLQEPAQMDVREFVKVVIESYCKTNLQEGKP